MGATNHTTNYELSQFIGTDKPAWLQDYNGDMAKIDAGIHQAKQAADAAQNDATQAGNAASANASAITSLQTNVGSLQTAVGTNTGNINTINSLIGNGTPTTTDQTIIGAINEINSGKLNKSTIVEAVADGVKSWIDLLNTFHSELQARHAAGTLNTDCLYLLIVDGTNYTKYNFEQRYSGSYFFVHTLGVAGNAAVDTIQVSGASAYRAGTINGNGYSASDISSQVPTSGVKIELHLV